MICPKCGADERSKKFIGPFCIDCYEFKIRLPRKKIIIEQCVKCKKIRLRGKWQVFSKKQIQEYVISKCKGEFNKAVFNLKEKRVVFEINVEGEKVFVSKPIDFEIKKTICKLCSRRLSGYYEAIVQLRGKPYKIRKWLPIFIKDLNKITFVSKVKELKEGVDLYIGSSKEVQKYIRKQGFKPTVSRKLAGVREGKRVYRTTYSIRF